MSQNKISPKYTFFSILSGMVMLCVSLSANAAVITDTQTVSPFSPNTSWSLTFDFGGPLTGITAVDLIMDPCNVFGNDSPLNCSDTIGTAEPVTVNIADLSPVFLPASVADIDVALIQSLTLTASLLADLSDGLITAAASTVGTGAEFIDFTLRVTTSASVPEPTTLALIGLTIAGIGYRRQRNKKAV